MRARLPPVQVLLMETRRRLLGTKTLAPRLPKKQEIEFEVEIWL